MKRIAIRVLFISAAWLVLASADVDACTSPGGCADCQNGTNNVASCITVSYDASCECSISANNRSMCILAGTCDYTGPGGGGGTGGGTGGGGTSCTRPASGWCPAECTSCGTVYWY